MTTWGDAIKAQREALGITHHALSVQSGVKWTNIKAIEEGTAGGRMETVMALYSTLGMNCSVSTNSTSYCLTTTQPPR